MARLSRWIVLAASALAPAGCGGTGAVPSLPQAPLASTAASAERTTTDVETSQQVYAYACDSDNACYAYDAGGNVLRKITRGVAGPQGIATDSKGHLFVTNYAKGTTVEYAPGGGKILNTMRDLRNSPVAVAVSESTSTVAVANTYGTNSASVSVYVSGAKTPTRVLSDSGISKGYDIAFDHKGNCYLMGYSAAFSGNNTIDEFAGCTGEPQSTGVIGLLNGLAFDGSDNLYFSQQGISYSAIWNCTGLTHCLPDVDSYLGDLGTMNFDKPSKTLIVSNYSSIDTVVVDGSESKLLPFASLGNNEVTGVAFSRGPAY